MIVGLLFLITLKLEDYLWYGLNVTDLHVKFWHGSFLQSEKMQVLALAAT